MPNNQSSQETDTIDNEQSLIANAQAQGWEVYAYSEYTNGIPAKAEIRRAYAYCKLCNCRITIGRCQHGVESPRETRKREAMEREYRERDMDTIREETQQERAFCNEADEIQRGEQRRRERNSKRDDTLTPRIDPREGYGHDWEEWPDS